MSDTRLTQVSGKHNPQGIHYNSADWYFQKLFARVDKQSVVDLWMGT